MSNSWVEKHRPDSWSDIQGNNKSLKYIRQWAEDWETGDEPQLLVGKAGTGKTTTAYVASDTLGYPLNQINASEARRTEDLKRIVRSVRSSPADADHQLVLLDEVDNWHHAVDKTKLYDALRDPKNPIILTGNDEYSIPGPIKSASNTHEFTLGIRSRKAKIKEIAEREGLDLDQQDLNSLAQRPDLRSAINDLQNWSGTGKPPVDDGRTWSENEFSAMEDLLGGDYDGWENAMDVESNTFQDLGSAILWTDENLSQEFRGLEAGVAYDLLSRADRRLRQGHDSQARGYPYVAALLDILPETRLSEPYDGYINVSFPAWFKSSKSTWDEETSEGKLFRKLKGEQGYGMACSYFEFRQRYLPILQNLPEEERLEIALNKGLDADEIEALELDPSDYEEWAEVESPEAGDGWSPDTDSASEADW